MNATLKRGLLVGTLVLLGGGSLIVTYFGKADCGQYDGAVQAALAGVDESRMPFPAVRFYSRPARSCILGYVVEETDRSIRASVRDLGRDDVLLERVGGKEVLQAYATQLRDLGWHEVLDSSFGR